MIKNISTFKYIELFVDDNKKSGYEINKQILTCPLRTYFLKAQKIWINYARIFAQPTMARWKISYSFIFQSLYFIFAKDTNESGTFVNPISL